MSLNNRITAHSKTNTHYGGRERISYEDVMKRIDFFPALTSHSYSTNNNAMTTKFVERFQAILLFVLVQYEYTRMVVSTEEYALIDEQQWPELSKPGYHRALGESTSK